MGRPDQVTDAEFERKLAQAKERNQARLYGAVEFPDLPAQRTRTSLAKYGLTPEQFVKLSIKQKDRCAICGLEQGERQFAIDHDHKTGAVRGLLCSKCNTGLGMFLDDQALLRTAITYLRKHQKALSINADSESGSCVTIQESAEAN